MTNSSGRLPREARGYSKTALVKGVETGARTWSTRRGASWLAARAAGKIASGPVGVALELFWPSNTIMSGAEEMRGLRRIREARERERMQQKLRTIPPWKQLPQSTLKPSVSDYAGAPTSNSYRVNRGDTLWKLAPKFGYQDSRRFVKDFQKHNPGVDPNRIYAGRNYTMPNRGQFGTFVSDHVGAPTSTSYRVNRGDTLWKLAPKFGYQDSRRFVKDFQKHNPGVDPNRIYAGRNYTMPNRGQFGTFGLR